MSEPGLLNPEKIDLYDNRNVDINAILPSVLLVKLSSLKQKGRVKVILCEPIVIMQINEVRIMEVNAKFTRFTDIKTFDGTFFNKEDKTLYNTFIKPEKPIFLILN